VKDNLRRKDDMPSSQKVTKGTQENFAWTAIVSGNQWDSPQNRFLVSFYEDDMYPWLLQ
jgi:hypothetical protein